MLGLNCLVDNQIDQAIDELSHAATASDTDALEVQMILGNLYRTKGQIGRAITLHQQLLQRPDLTRLEQAKREQGGKRLGAFIVLLTDGANNRGALAPAQAAALAQSASGAIVNTGAGNNGRRRNGNAGFLDNGVYLDGNIICPVAGSNGICPLK